MSWRVEGEDLLRARTTILSQTVVLLLIAGVLSMIPTTIQVLLPSASSLDRQGAANNRPLPFCPHDHERLPHICRR